MPAELTHEKVTAIGAGDLHSLAVNDASRVVAWGSNNFGQTEVPAVLDSERVTAVAGGVGHSLALTTRYKVVTWGYNGGSGGSLAFPTR